MTFLAAEIGVTGLALEDAAGEEGATGPDRPRSRRFARDGTKTEEPVAPGR